jgi:hypothetical protein
MYSIWIILACVACLFSVMTSLCSGVITQILNVCFVCVLKEFSFVFLMRASRSSSMTFMNPSRCTSST